MSCQLIFTAAGTGPALEAIGSETIEFEEECEEECEEEFEETSFDDCAVQPSCVSSRLASKKRISQSIHVGDKP